MLTKIESLPYPACNLHASFLPGCDDCKERCESKGHVLDLMERSWTEPRDGTTWLHCAVCQKHVWTVPTRLLA